MTDQQNNQSVSKYIRFEMVNEKPKTRVYDVINRSSGWSIGQVKWYPNWRQYCFFPENECVFTKVCMNDINDFIERLMTERRIGND